jgi:hypothetical protein
MGTEQLLQSLSGPRELRDALAGEQARPVTPADLDTVVHGGSEGASARLVLRHGPEQPLPPPRDSRPGQLVVVVEDMRGAMDPTRGDADVGPQRVGLVAPTLHERL